MAFEYMWNLIKFIKHGIEFEIDKDFERLSFEDKLRVNASVNKYFSKEM